LTRYVNRENIAHSFGLLFTTIRGAALRPSASAGQAKSDFDSSPSGPSDLRAKTQDPIWEAIFMRFRSSFAYTLLLIGSVAGLSVPATAQSIPATVEDLVPESDLIVLGVVTKTDPEAFEAGDDYKMVFTRHAFRVETYFKGTGPAEISLFTAGGFRTLKINGETKQTYTTVSGSEQVKDGERFIAFLRAGPGGYVFAEWDTAKYPVTKDGTTSGESVTLRLRKRAYLRGSALSSFDRLQQTNPGPDSASKTESNLKGTRGIGETILLRDIRERLTEIVHGESGS